MVGVFISMGLLSLIWFMSIIAMVSSMSSSSSSSAMLKSNEKVLKLSFNGDMKETTSNNPFENLFSNTTTISLNDVLTAIDAAKENDNIKGIYIDASDLSTGSANIDVIRRKLIDFKKDGKFVVAYADNYTQQCYYLASVADKVFVNPLGKVLLSGFASQTTFYKGILEKAGVEVVVFKVGTFKGAVEPFMLDKLSDANRAQITSYQRSIWENIVGDIASSRNIQEAKINDFADKGYMFASAEKAIEYGLADEVKYRDDAENYIKELAGIGADEKFSTVGVTKMKNIKKRNIKLDSDQIAVIYAEGEILNSLLAPKIGSENYITEKLVDELIKLKKNDKVKAVVLRVNSPGGDAFLSEQIWKQIEDLKKDKKVVVSMGVVAASGGYYISCGADKIISEANTLTGSIGVFGTFPNATGLFNKLSLTTDVVKTNKFADFGDYSRPMRDDEKVLLQSHIESIYDTFITRCSEGRGKTKEEIDNIGQGRVWTGEQALEIGLVDELGGLDRAIEVAADLAGLTDYTVKTVSSAKDPFAELFKSQMNEMKSSVLKDALGEDYELMNVIRTIRYTSGIKARLPYDLEAL